MASVACAGQSSVRTSIAPIAARAALLSSVLLSTPLATVAQRSLRSMPPSPLVTPRAAVALVLGAFASAIGGLILGEYDFSGAMPYAAGLLFGLVIAEIVLELGRVRSWLVGAIAGGCVAGALGWAAWISSGEGLR